MNLLGIEGGGTRTSVLLVDSTTDTVLTSLTLGPGNLHLLSREALWERLEEIRRELRVTPDRIGIGFAGVRSEGDRERLTAAVTHSGKVMGNLMIDLNPSNGKLRNRAVRIVHDLTGADEATALATLERNGWIVRAACEALRSSGE